MTSAMSGKTSHLAQAFSDGIAKLSNRPNGVYIDYVTSGFSDKWTDPEEQVRAELWAELIYKYEYPPSRIGFEVLVPRRKANDKADLVIFRDDEHKDPYFVIECKPSQLSDAEFMQAIDQACGNRANLGAPFCAAVAGRTRRLLRFDENFPAGERDRNHLADIPRNYGAPLEWRFYKEPGKDLVAVSRDDLRSAIRKCHQTLWEGGRRSPIAAFGEFCKIVFVKHRDEKDLSRLKGEPYAFQRRTGETDKALARRVHALYATEQKLDRNVFADKVQVDASILAKCVEHLEAISLDRTELDTKGVAFEEFMGSFFKGDFGQYFTPRELVAFCVAALDPDIRDRVLDPACGSAGFLLYAMDHIRRKADIVQNHGTVEHYKYWHDFAERKLYGIEINEELARVAKMNMILHDDGHTNIVGHDALDFVARLTKKNRNLVEGGFNLILTNPPFGAKVRRSEKGDDYLGQFDLMRYLGKTYPTEKVKRDTIKTEIAFLERIWQFLQPDGRAAVVLPDSVLTNSSSAGVREWVLDRFQLLAVFSLPQFAFNHYDAGVKASIVFLRRREDDEVASDDELVFMALVGNIGYDAAGRRTFNVTSRDAEDERNETNYRRETHSCDLFSYDVEFEWGTNDDGKKGWSERSRSVLADTGLVETWHQFVSNPSSIDDNEPVAHERVYSSGIDHLILEELNVPPEPPQVYVFKVATQRVRSSRLDPGYHSPKFRAIRDSISNGRYPSRKIRDLCEHLVSGSAAGAAKQAYDEATGIPHLRPLNLDTLGRLSLEGTKFVRRDVIDNANLVQLDEVLFNNTNSTDLVGKSAVFEFDQDCACSNHITRLKVKDDLIDPHYLAAVLNALRRIGYLGLLSTNFNNQAGINTETLGDLRIPVPPLEQQLEIAEKIQAIRARARRLQERAEEILGQA